MLLSSHLLHQVEQVCDRIGIFVGGRLVGIVTVADLAGDLHDDWIFELGVDPGPAASQLAGVVGRVPGVRSVDADGPGRWMITAGRDVHAELIAAVASSGCTLDHFIRRGADLDAIYHRYFTGRIDDRDTRLSA